MLTNREAVVPPRVCDAEGGRADRCMSRVRERRGLLGYPVTELSLHPCKLTLQHGDAAARGLDVGRDAEWAHAESPAFPGGAHRSADRYHARGVHADGQKEVLSRRLCRSRSHRVLDDQRVNVEGLGHDCAGGQEDGCFSCEALGISRGA